MTREARSGRGAEVALDLRSPQGLMALQRLPRVGRARALRAALGGRVPTEPTGPDAPGVAEASAWADQQMARSRQAGAEVVTFFDDRYPPNLSRIADPPVVLYVR